MKVIGVLILGLVITGVVQAKNTAKYCAGMADMAMGYVEDRDVRQPYITTLLTIDAAVAKSNLDSAESAKFLRDMRASAKISARRRAVVDLLWPVGNIGCRA